MLSPRFEQPPATGTGRASKRRMGGENVASKEYVEVKKQQESLAVIEEKRQAFHHALDDYNSTANEARQKTWDASCENCDPGDSSVASKIWKLAKVLKDIESESGPSPKEVLDAMAIL